MEKGVACISTEEGGIRDIIDDKKTGFITKRQDACSIAESIKKLIDNSSLRTEMAQAGRKKFQEKFTEERFEKTMIDCLKQCIVSKL